MIGRLSFLVSLVGRLLRLFRFHPLFYGFKTCLSRSAASSESRSPLHTFFVRRDSLPLLPWSSSWFCVSAFFLCYKLHSFRFIPPPCLGFFFSLLQTFPPLRPFVFLLFLNNCYLGSMTPVFNYSLILASAFPILISPTRKVALSVSFFFFVLFFFSCVCIGGFFVHLFCRLIRTAVSLVRLSAWSFLALAAHKQDGDRSLPFGGTCLYRFHAILWSTVKLLPISVPCLVDSLPSSFHPVLVYCVLVTHPTWRFACCEPIPKLDPFFLLQPFYRLADVELSSLWHSPRCADITRRRSVLIFGFPLTDSVASSPRPWPLFLFIVLLLRDSSVLTLGCCFSPPPPFFPFPAYALPHTHIFFRDCTRSFTHPLMYSGCFPSSDLFSSIRPLWTFFLSPSFSRAPFNFQGI